jgi:bifunctional UDP-N-acetylglucosamine pyrophosphorylase/glucosamine-1-phosphate N-acetyltransferase
MMSALHAIILAAGQGKRMKSSMPKVLHPICGRPMILYSVEMALYAGVKQPIVVLGPDSEEIQKVLPKAVKVAIQEKPQGTGDAVLCARKVLNASMGNVLILYADAPLLRRTTIQNLIESHAKSSAACTLLTAHLADPTGYGRILRNEFGQVSGIAEETDANSQQRAIREVNIGPLVCKLSSMIEALEQIQPSGATKELYLTQVVNALAAAGKKINVAHASDVWESLGINSRVELAKATGIVRQRLIELHLTRGVTVEDPNNTYIEHNVDIGQDTVIRPGCYIESGVVIGKRCTIGPYAHLRKGVVIGNDTRVGNFAELVRTQVGERVKINHVSYLGDAVVGDDVNIGAGTITANFNGVEKSQTTIGKGAFIGSDTVLVAPVEVGAGASTGAGCVVPKGQNVPARAVVVGVPARRLDGRSPAPSTAGTGRKAVVVDRPAPKRVTPEGPKEPKKAVRATGKDKPVSKKASQRVSATA